MITVSLVNQKKLQLAEGTQAKTILKELAKSIGIIDVQQIVAVRINNSLCPLSQHIDFDAEIEPVLLDSRDGSGIYRRTLCFVLAAAAYKLFPNIRLLVGHSLGYGYYYTLDTTDTINEKDIAALQDQMQKIIDTDSEITTSIISYQQAIELFERINLIETRKQLKYLCPPSITINSLDGFSDLYFSPLLESTGGLKVFELRKYGEGFLLRFPQTTKPDELPPFEDNQKLFSVYQEYKAWGKLLNVTSVASLNELIHNRKIKDFINVTETLQTKRIADVADQIKAHQNVRMVLIAGPSSSGKTTTSKKLSLQLQVLGYTPKIIELDSYYVGRDVTPRDENGDYDYETLEALAVDLLNENLVDLFAGKEIPLPSYDFVEGKRFYSGKKMKLEPGDILILEGIHGLNDKLTPLIPAEKKFKIYLSALTQLNLDDHNRIPTSDNRLIRRIVRDAQFRGKSAADTIKMWPNVQKGERLHIFPFQDNADAMLNTALDYELAVLKIYATPLLRCVTPFEKEYSEASRLLSFLNNFSSLPPTFVPGQSLIREFIGGSEFKY